MEPAMRLNMYALPSRDANKRRLATDMLPEFVIRESPPLARQRPAIELSYTLERSNQPAGNHRTSIRRSVAAESPPAEQAHRLPSAQTHHSSLERYAGNEAASTAHVFGFAAGHDVSIVTHNVDDCVATFFPGALL